MLSTNKNYEYYDLIFDDDLTCFTYYATALNQNMIEEYLCLGYITDFYQPLFF